MRELTPFLISSREHFLPLSARRIRPEFATLLRQILPPAWTVRRQDIWLMCRPSRAKEPSQGFKIHMSANLSNIVDVIRIAADVCGGAGTSFKIVADRALASFLLSRGYNRSGSGKCVTIYPADVTEFTTLADDLAVRTAHLSGPYILSDRRHPRSQVVFYRYGGFERRSRLKADGQRESLLCTPDGSLAPDLRQPFFQLPEWVVDPYPASDPVPAATLLNGRYEIEDALAFTNCGGVYRARDVETRAEVIVKEARPHTSSFVHTEGTGDAVSLRAREYAVLKRLAHLRCVPQPIALFTEWEHTFLVEEFVEGVPLAQFRAREDVNLIPFTGGRRRVDRFARNFAKIGLALCRAVASVHAEGIVLGDLSPNNVLLRSGSEEIVLIDFEAASDLAAAGPDDEFAQSLATPGFRAGRRRTTGRLTPQDDEYALGMLLFSLLLPVQALNEICEEATLRLLDRIATSCFLPAFIQEVIVSLLHGDSASAIRLLMEAVETPIVPVTHPVRRRGRLYSERVSIPHLAEQAARYIRAAWRVRPDAEPMPMDYMAHRTNVLSIAYGAAGALFALHYCGQPLPDHALEWLIERSRVDELPPGLYTGHAGVACLLAELGHLDDGRNCLERALHSPLLDNDMSLFQGTAGVGLACLHMAAASGDLEYVRMAEEQALRLQRLAENLGPGCVWPTTGTDVRRFGMGYGNSGIALFLAHLWRATSDYRWRTLMDRALEFEAAQGVPLRGGLTWGRFEGDHIAEPYWLFGGCGVGSAFIRCFALTQDERYLTTALAAARSSLSLFSVMPGQFEGLSGIGEFMLDMYKATAKGTYLRAAQRIAQNIAAYRLVRPGGLAFPGRALLRVSNDFGYGTSGVMVFLSRVIQPRSRILHDVAPLSTSPARPLQSQMLSVDANS